MNTYEQARETMWSNAVSVCIYPIILDNEPMSSWFWDVEITIPNNQWENSDEDGNFIVMGSNPGCFASLEDAFQWAYKWLNGRGYDVSNIEMSMNSVAHNGFHHKNDYAKVVEAREANA
jgi:hypothetical protein